MTPPLTRHDSPGQTFFNVAAEHEINEKHYSFGFKSTKYNVETNWRTLEDQPMTSQSIFELLANRVPVVRHHGVFSEIELSKMREIVKRHELDEYNPEFTWPRVSTFGITQYDHAKDPQRYFDATPAANSLLQDWKLGAGIDVIQRVIDVLTKATGLPVHRATDGEQEYFAGLLRGMQSGIAVHADYAPFEAANWSIGGVVSQLTWNVLLNEVAGGDTLIYDRQWQCPADDRDWRKTIAHDSYHPQMLEGHVFKAMMPIPGDLTVFNSRNFHEVKACETSFKRPEADIRFTISSFIGFIPAQEDRPASLVIWS